MSWLDELEDGPGACAKEDPWLPLDGEQGPWPVCTRPSGHGGGCFDGIQGYFWLSDEYLSGSKEIVLGDRVDR